MINVKKNLLVTTSLVTLLLVAMCLAVVMENTHGMATLIVLISLVVLVYFRRVRQTHLLTHRVRLFDLNEKGEPLDMLHNDEREWRLMLTANYVSGRVTGVFLIVVLGVCYVLTGSDLYSGMAFLPTRYSLQYLLALVSILVTSATLIGEWSFLIAYFRLDRD